MGLEEALVLVARTLSAAVGVMDQSFNTLAGPVLHGLLQGIQRQVHQGPQNGLLDGLG